MYLPMVAYYGIGKIMDSSLVKPIRLFRDLRLKNVELFKLREGVLGSLICYMLIVDFNRESTIEDFPYLKGLGNESEFIKSNFIKGLVVSGSPIHKERKNEIVEIASEFFDNSGDYDWNLDFKILNEEDLKEENVRKALEVLLKEKYGQDINLSNISKDKVNHLSQD
ncbi:hypothetical protein GCM10008905_21710 [Clostridium malenominatum]|uniref:Uncharacterized protein n=1 Tax=Clostridium malenominatum TaxID=1539 RepID=A0ABN1J1E1_9CLOT